MECLNLGITMLNLVQDLGLLGCWELEGWLEGWGCDRVRVGVGGDLYFSLVDEHIGVFKFRVCWFITPKSLISQILNIKLSNTTVIKLQPLISFSIGLQQSIIMATLG